MKELQLALVAEPQVEEELDGLAGRRGPERGGRGDGGWQRAGEGDALRGRGGGLAEDIRAAGSDGGGRY